MECEMIGQCEFINHYQNQNKIVINGFINKYCKSKESSNKCIRKRLMSILEINNKIPINMMPNGLCYPGTDKSEWSNEMKKYYFIQNEG